MDELHTAGQRCGEIRGGEKVGRIRVGFIVFCHFGAQLRNLLFVRPKIAPVTFVTAAAEVQIVKFIQCPLRPQPPFPTEPQS